ncbi:MAG: ABC transporter ATP-binding protein/permease [Beijerinckiaceae bacterium]|nr:ABC transporter ATP-binding protein/permease [Beijerinckiaceae bacterium]
MTRPTSDIPVHEAPAPPGPRAGRAIRFLRFSIGYWKGDSRRQAWLLSAGTMAFLLATVGAALAVNAWNKYFFDALSRKDVDALWYGVGLVLALAAISALTAMGLLQMRMLLQVRWRQWVTRALVARWLSERRFYQLNVVGGDAENPEARMTEDTRLATELFVEFAVGAFNAVISAVTFVGVLWFVGGAINIGGTHVPGYFVIACLLYSGLTTAAMLWLGRPLVRTVEDKAAGEAQFRYELTRVRDSAENIALIGGESEERARLSDTFRDLMGRWRAVIWKQGHMTWITGANYVLAPVAPLLLGAPKFLSGEMSLGSLMQAASAFVQVQIALNWMANNALRLADWFASARRVSDLTDALDNLDATIGKRGTDDTVSIGVSPDENVRLVNVSIAQHDGTIMIEDADTSIAPGEKVLVRGESGSGKSTLIRAIAGLWPWGAGEVLIPKDARVTFMPQRPYFPLGTLRGALLYPNTDREEPQERIEDALKRCGLAHLAPRLDSEENWSAVLSGGEQQRTAFARVLLDPPDVLIMDEPTSALDEASQEKMMSFFRDDLAKTCVIHVGHRPGLEVHHDREIHLLREAGGPAFAEERPSGISGRLWRYLRKRRPQRAAA